MKKFMWMFLLTLLGCDTIADGLAPKPCNTLAAVSLEEGESQEVTTCFTDPEGERLTLSVVSSDVTIATAQVLGTVVAITALTEGLATLTVTATDPGGLSVDASLIVTVTGIPEPELLLVDEFSELSSGWTAEDVSLSGIEDGNVWLTNDNKDKIATLWHTLDAENPSISARVKNGTDDFWSTLLIDTGDSRISTIAVIFGADVSRMDPDLPTTNYIVLIWDSTLGEAGAWGLMLYGQHPTLKGPGESMDVVLEVNEQNIRILVDGQIVEEESRDSLIPTTILRVGIGGTWPEDVPPTTESRVYFDRIKVIGLKTGN